MSDPYLGEIRAFGFNFAPYASSSAWMFCNGQLLAISQYTALFSIIGTYYGGNGTTTFQLPNLQGAIPMSWGSPPGLTSTVLGEAQGAAQVTLITSQMPQHNHGAQGFPALQTSGQKVAAPSAAAWIGDCFPDATYSTVSPTVAMSQYAIGLDGNGVPHENMQPYQCVNFCICYQGVFPSRN
jgi:microcystin-dependent protein